MEVQSHVPAVGEAPVAKAALLDLWSQLRVHEKACCMAATSQLPSASDDLTRLLEDYADLHPPTYAKSICTQGAVCLARIEWSSSDYTGLFQRADYCLLRCSSALPSNLDSPACPMMPRAPGTLGKSVVMPFVALKAFRAGRGSGNLLFGGRKTGQEEVDYFAHCACTHFTERCGLAMWPILRRFKSFSEFPCQCGLSDFAASSQDGREEQRVNFPWCLVIKPAMSTGSVADGENFLGQLDGIEAGTRLFHILACATPADASHADQSLQHVGTIVTASKFLQSELERRLRFRHQLKEDDYLLNPQWKAALTPAHKNYGWEHFEKFPEAAPEKPLAATAWEWPEEDNDAESFASFCSTSSPGDNDDEDYDGSYSSFAEQRGSLLPFPCSTCPSFYQDPEELHQSFAIAFDVCDPKARDRTSDRRCSERCTNQCVVQ